MLTVKHFDVIIDIICSLDKDFNKLMECRVDVHQTTCRSSKSYCYALVRLLVMTQFATWQCDVRDIVSG